MNSKLRNTALALASTSVILMLAMLSSVPANPTQPNAAPAVAVRGLDVGSAIAFEDTSALTASNAALTESSTTRPTRKSKRHRRQTLVMPFFSFAPRG